jgi:DNA-nicking Smr family endonuclease
MDVLPESPAGPGKVERPRRPSAPINRSVADSAPISGDDGLDSHWDRRFARGGVTPDFTLDLHGHSLDQAHARLEAGLAQARTMGARVVLVIAGKPRPAEAADRGNRRGAIRAKLLDWLAAGPHGREVVAVRSAHRRHGGEGALYLVLKRPR